MITTITFSIQYDSENITHKIIRAVLDEALGKIDAEYKNEPEIVDFSDE